jgi:phospholipid/cholesterol/gamma-HCH transport system substrate-binding protein
VSTRSSLVKFLVFVAATLLATGTLAATIANIQFGDKATYTAVFNDVTGLANGQEVRIAGVRVGEVTGIKVARDRVHADVELKVLKTSVLTQGTKATIKYRNLVGERYVALTQEAGGALPLKDGATIGLDHTQSALDLTVLFNGFKPLFAALSPKDVNELSGNIISVLQGEGGNINSLLAKTASLTSTLADRDEVIGRTISNLNTVLGTVDEHDAAPQEVARPSRPTSPACDSSPRASTSRPTRRRSRSSSPPRPARSRPSPGPRPTAPGSTSTCATSAAPSSCPPARR